MVVARRPRSFRRHRGGGGMATASAHVYPISTSALALFPGSMRGPIVVDFIQHTYLVAKPRYSMAALPAAYLLAAVGLSCLHSRARSDSRPNRMCVGPQHPKCLP